MTKKKTKKAAALMYKKSMQAPKLVASGSGKIAEAIEKIAQQESIPIVKNSSLVRELIKLDINTQIPESLYKAVAKVLVYLYKMDKKL